MNLAAGVGFWDVDPQAMGEDFHMSLKCFFSTHGKVKIHTIYSPASCCNVQGDSWIKSLKDRYTQAVRHLWGSLDFGYTLRRSIFSLVAPDHDAPNNVLVQVPLVSEYPLDYSAMHAKVGTMIYRVCEAHMVMGQFLLLMIISTLTIPYGDKPSVISQLYWYSFSPRGVHPYLELALALGGMLRITGSIIYGASIFYYERYQYWCGVQRWNLSFAEQMDPGTGKNVSPLGKRSKLVYKRTLWNILDWSAIPIGAIVFLAIPQMTVQLRQLFTDQLDYKVAGKPMINSSTIDLKAEHASDSAFDHRELTDNGSPAK
jgi:hypothetical protein